jgi:hypothetical protein
MGFCYQDGKLCCDFCGKAGGARKTSCPFNVCWTVAACGDCKKKHPDQFSKAGHRARGCEASAARYAEQEKRKKALYDAGVPVLRSAGMLHFSTGEANRARDAGLVKVTFESKCGWFEVVMLGSIYDQRSTLPRDPTLADFEALQGGTPFPTLTEYLERVAEGEEAARGGALLVTDMSASLAQEAA